MARSGACRPSRSDGFGLHVVSTATCPRSFSRSAPLLCAIRQALLQKPGEFLLAHTPAPARHRGAVVRELVPEYSLEVRVSRSEEHTSELQSLRHLVCRLLL